MPEYLDYIKTVNKPIKGIIHIGAHYAEEAQYYQNNYGVPVLWFEAHPVYAQKMRANIARFNNQKGFEACLSNVDNSTVEFWITKDEYASSMLKPAFHQIQNPHALISDKIQLTTKRFDTFVKEQLKDVDMTQFNVLILDVQGSEKMVWEGIGDYQNQFDIIISEYSTVEFYENVPRLSELDVAYKNFKRIFPEPHAQNIAIHGDALYLRG